MNTAIHLCVFFANPRTNTCTFKYFFSHEVSEAINRSFTATDLNGAGHAAAWVCGHRNVLSNNDVERVTIRWPAIGDFNDMIMNGAVVYEWPLLRTA